MSLTDEDSSENSIEETSTAPTAEHSMDGDITAVQKESPSEEPALLPSEEELQGEDPLGIYSSSSAAAEEVDDLYSLLGQDLSEDIAEEIAALQENVLSSASNQEDDPNEIHVSNEGTIEASASFSSLFQRSVKGQIHSEELSRFLSKQLLLNRFSLKTKIKSIFFVMALCLCSLGSFGLLGLHQLHTTTQKTLSHPFQLSSASVQIHHSLSIIEQSVTKSFSVGDTDLLSTHIAQIEEERRNLETILRQLRTQPYAQELQLEKLSDGIHSLRLIQNKALGILKNDEPLEAFAVVKEELYPTINSLKQYTGRLSQTALEIASTYEQQSEAQAGQTEFLMLFLLTLSILSGGILTFIVSTTTHQEITDINRKLGSISQGELRTTPFVHIGNDELSTIKQSYNRLRSQLISLVQLLRTNSKTIQKTANDMSRSSHERFTEVHEQVALAEQTKQTLIQLLDKSQKVSGASSLLMSNAQTTHTTTNAIEEHLAKLMNNLQDVTKSTHQIKQIALKSELLALNASLEGIHAGEAGTGFSLVASEMQQLAESVLQLAKDIDGTHRTIRSSTDQTLNATEQTKILSNETTQSAQNIVTLAQSQEKDSEEASSIIENIVHMTYQHSSKTEELILISSSLTDLAQTMKDAIADFSIEEQEDTLEEDDTLLDDLYLLV